MNVLFTDYSHFFPLKSHYSRMYEIQLSHIGILPSCVLCCFLKVGLQSPVLRGTRQKTKLLRVRGGNAIGSDRECGKGSPCFCPV